MDIGADWVVVWILILMLGFFYAMYEYLREAIKRWERVTREQHESLIDGLGEVSARLRKISRKLDSIDAGDDSYSPLHANLRNSTSSLAAIERVVERLLVKSGG